MFNRYIIKTLNKGDKQMKEYNINEVDVNEPNIINLEQEVNEYVYKKIPDLKVDEPQAYQAETLEDIKFLQNYTKVELASSFNSTSYTKPTYPQIAELKALLTEENKTIQNQDIADFLETFDRFYEKAAALPENVDDKTADDFFNGPNGYRAFVIGLKRVLKVDDISGKATQLTEEVIENFETMLMSSMNTYEHGGFMCNKYIALNSGEFNMAEGEDLLEGISKATAGYHWFKTVHRKQKLSDPSVKDEAFSLDRINSVARKMYSRKEFKDTYLIKQDGKKVWNLELIKDTVNKKSEWKVNNKLENRDREKTRESLKKTELEKRIQAAQKKALEEKMALEENNNHKEYNNINAVSASKPANSKKADNSISPEEKDLSEDDFFNALFKQFIDDHANEPKKKKKLKEEKPLYKADNQNANDVRSNVNAEEKVIAKYTYAAKDITSSEDKGLVSGTAIMDTFSTLSQELKNYIKLFRNAQVNKEANDEKSTTIEGPNDYRSILKDMYNLVTLIDNNNINGVTLGTLGDKLVALTNKVRKYEAKHKPNFRGHRTAESAERYRLMEDFADRGDVYKRTLNTLSKEAYKNARENNIELNIRSCSIPNFREKLSKSFPVKNPETLSKNAKLTAEFMLLSAERNMYKERILSGLASDFNYDVRKYYNEMEPRSSRSYDNGIFNTKNDLLNKMIAGSYEIAEASVVRRELRKLVTEDVSINELKESSKRIKDKSLKEEIIRINNSRGYHIDMDTARIVGIKDKVGISERLVSGLEYNRKGMEKISNAFNTMTIKEINGKYGYLKRYKHISNNLIYNIAVANVLKKPENTKILLQFMSPNSGYNDDEAAESAKRAVKKDVFNFLKKNGIINKIKAEKGLGSDEKLSISALPTLMKYINDPKFEKSFTKMLDKSTERQMEKYQERIRENAREFARKKAEARKDAKKYAKLNI